MTATSDGGAGKPPGNPGTIDAAVPPPAAVDAGNSGCRSGEPCAVPGQPCAIGATVCSGGVPGCGVTGAAPDGADCGAGRKCRSGACQAVPLSRQGEACMRDDACESGVCVDSVCCDRRCSTCESCAHEGRKGVCSEIVATSDGDSCGSATDVCLGKDRCGQIDQSQPMGDPIGANGSLWEAPEVASRVAQSFQVERDGRLAGVRIQMKCPPGAGAIAEIQTTARGSWGGVQPSGQVLASQPVSSESLKGTQLLRLIIFDRPPMVQRGTRLAVVFKSDRQGVPTDNIPLCYVYLIPRNPYPTGEALRLRGAGFSNWEPRTSNVGDGPEDLAFETILVP